jgi:DNA-binding beta-propeller fold protein YncE
LGVLPQDPLWLHSFLFIPKTPIKLRHDMIKLYWSLALLLIVGTGLFLVFGTKTPALPDKPAENQAENQIIKEGLSIAMTFNSVSSDKKTSQNLIEGQSGRLQFSILDSNNKQPVKGLHPSVWLDRENPQNKSQSCKDKINSYLQTQMGYKPEISLNSYFVLAMNNNPTISVIDPINGYGGTKLLARINLNSPAVDWVISKDHKKLYVATPLTRQVALVDTETWKVISFLLFDGTPTRLALQPDGKYLWVGLEASDEKFSTGINVIDTEKFTVAKPLATGAGHHEFVFSDDSRTAYVSNKDDVSIIDVDQLAIKQSVKTPVPTVRLAFSALSKSVYAATENGKLLVINGAANTELDMGVPLKTLRFNADGRWGFALSQTASKLFIIDTSLNRLAHTVELSAAPDQISFTDHYAYIHSANSEVVSMIELDSLSKNNTTPPVTTFQGGQAAPSQADTLLTDAIVSTPERNSVVIANPTDKTVYFYMEGMAAPMGNFENQGLKPMAVMIVNRSVQETAPGIYTASTQLPPAGYYHVSILLDNPSVYHCFTTDISPNPELIKQSSQAVKVDYLLDNKEVPVGISVPIKIKLTHSDQERVKDSVKDLQVMIVRIPGQWQQRMIAKAQGNGIYQVDITPPDLGVYQVFVQSPTLNFTFNQQSTLIFRAVKAEQ